MPRTARIALPVAAACVGVAWVAYRWARKPSRSRSRNEPIDAPLRPVRRRSKSGLVEDPPENLQLRAHIDAALRLLDLQFKPLGTEKGSVETAYSAEAPTWIAGASSDGVYGTAATLVAAGTSSVLTLLALLAAATASLGLCVLVALLSVVAAALFVLHSWDLGIVARHLAARGGGPRAAVVRAVAEVQPDGMGAAWRAAAAWALAGPDAAGSARGYARRDALVVLVEARPSALPAAPIEAFLLQPRDAECRRGLTVHAYIVSSSSQVAMKAAAAVVARLQELLALGNAPAATLPCQAPTDCVDDAEAIPAREALGLAVRYADDADGGAWKPEGSEDGVELSSFMTHGSRFEIFRGVAELASDELSRKCREPSVTAAMVFAWAVSFRGSQLTDKGLVRVTVLRRYSAGIVLTHRLTKEGDGLYFVAIRQAGDDCPQRFTCAIVPAPNHLVEAYAVKIDRLRRGQTLKAIELRFWSVDVQTLPAGGIRVCTVIHVEPKTTWGPFPPAAIVRSALRVLPCAARGVLDMARHLHLPSQIALEGPEVEGVANDPVVGLLQGALGLPLQGADDAAPQAMREA